MLFCQNRCLLNNKFEFNHSQHFLTRIVEGCLCQLNKKLTLDPHWKWNYYWFSDDFETLPANTATSLVIAHGRYERRLCSQADSKRRTAFISFISFESRWHVLYMLSHTLAGRWCKLKHRALLRYHLLHHLHKTKCQLFKTYKHC